MRVPPALSRQARLPEVGAEGLIRIAQTRFVAGDGADPLDVEREYLARAGATSFAPRDAPIAFPHAARFRHAAPRQLAAGAWSALAQLRAALGVAGAPAPAGAARDT